MERLIGNFWFHDDGGGEVSLYERLGARMLPIRIETEGLPDRVPFEARAEIERRLAERLKDVQKRKPLDVKLQNLEVQLQQFPNWLTLPEDDKVALRTYLSNGLEDEERPVHQAVPAVRPQTTEEMVKHLNVQRAIASEAKALNALADKESEIASAEAMADELAGKLLAEAAEKADADARALAVKDEQLSQLRAKLALLEGKEDGKATQGQDAGRPEGLLGQEARQETRAESEAGSGGS